MLKDSVPAGGCLLKKICLAASLILIMVVINLAGGSEYPFGTKVLPADADVGRPLYSIAAEISVGYWDTGAPGYDETDTVYLHVAPKGYPATKAGDVRLTAFVDHPAGSKLMLHDDDMNMPLTPLPATISYLNLRGSQAYDLEDPVYLHQGNRNYDGRTMDDEMMRSEAMKIEGPGGEVPYAYRNLRQNKKTASDSEDGFRERLPYRDSGISIPGASRVAYSDDYKLLLIDRFVCSAPAVAGFWRGFGVEVIHGLKADYYHVLGTWLVKIAPHETNAFGLSGIEAFGSDFVPAMQFLCTNDIRLGGASGLAAGTKVTDFDPDQNKLVAFPALVSFAGWPAVATRIRYFDVNGNGVYDYPDDLYLNFPEAGTTSTVAVNNLRLSGPVF